MWTVSPFFFLTLCNNPSSSPPPSPVCFVLTLLAFSFTCMKRDAVNSLLLSKKHANRNAIIILKHYMYEAMKNYTFWQKKGWLIFALYIKISAWFCHMSTNEFLNCGTYMYICHIALFISIMTVNFLLCLARKLQSENFEKILLFNCSIMVH